MKRLVAEFIGTFALVFTGTGAIVIDEVTGGAVTHVGAALTFGLIVLAMIYTLGDISGAHINPAVTVGFWFSGRFAAHDVLPYVASQCAGALAASGVLRFLFPQNRLLGTTLPGWSALAVLCAGISPDGNSDVCDPAGFDWFAGQRNYRRDCGWVSDRSGSDVCRADLPPAASLDLL